VPLSLTQSLKAIWAPVLLLVLFAAGELLAPDLMRDMGMQAVAELRYVAQIGLWLSGAFLVVRLLDFFCGSGSSAVFCSARCPGC